MNASARRIRFTEPPPTTVPFELDNGIPIVEAVVPDGRRRPFALDTGAATTVLRIDAGGLPATRPDTIGYADPDDPRSIRYDYYRGYDLGLGTIWFDQFDVAAADMNPALTSDSRHPFAGLVGWPLLSGLLLTVDYDAGQITIEPGALPSPDGSDVLPLRVNASHNLELPATLDGHDLWLILDTCWHSPDNVDVAAAVGDRLRWTVPRRSVNEVRIGGNYTSTAGGVIAGDLTIGRYVVHNPVVGTSADDRSGLSSATLRHFRVTVDARNRRLRLVGPADAPTGIARLTGEDDYDEAAERVSNARRIRRVTVDPAASRRGVTARTRQGAWIIERPGRATLVATASGVFFELSGQCRLLVRVDGGPLVDRRGGTVARWYEQAAPGNGGSVRAVTLNPNGYPRDRYSNPATGSSVTVWQGIKIVEQPDGSSHVVLTDGVVLDTSVTGDGTVSWPNR